MLNNPFPQRKPVEGLVIPKPSQDFAYELLTTFPVNPVYFDITLRHGRFDFFSPSMTAQEQIHYLSQHETMGVNPFRFTELNYKPQTTTYTPAETVHEPFNTLSEEWKEKLKEGKAKRIRITNGPSPSLDGTAAEILNKTLLPSFRNQGYTVETAVLISDYTLPTGAVHDQPSLFICDWGETHSEVNKARLASSPYSLDAFLREWLADLEKKHVL